MNNLPNKRAWDPNFLDSLRDVSRGKPIQFELVDGKKASGKIGRWEHSGDELTSISGQLSEPEAGRFFFRNKRCLELRGRISAW